MPFNGAGVYTAPGADFPAVTQTVISSTHYNNVINDIATALSLTLTRDGQATVTGNIPFGGFRATNIGITGIAGSVGTPAINVSDPGTGLYRSAASELAVTVAGTQRGRFDSTGLIVTGTVNASTSVVTPLVGPGSNVDFTIQIPAGPGNIWTFKNGTFGSTSGDFVPVSDNAPNIGGPANRVAKIFTPIIDSGTTGSLSLKTNNGTEQVRVSHTGSAVNFVQLSGAPTGSFVQIGAGGSDTDISIEYFSKAAGAHNFYTNGGGQLQFQVLHTASSTRNITVTGSNGGNPTIGVTAGSLAITPAVVITGASLSIGTTPAAAGVVRVPYSSGLAARNSANSGDQSLITIQTTNGQTDIVRVGGGIYSADGPGSVLFGARLHAGAPTTSDVPTGQCIVWEDSSGVTVKLYYNNGSVLKAVALT